MPVLFPSNRHSFSTGVVTALPWTCSSPAFWGCSADGRCRNRKLCLLAAALSVVTRSRVMPPRKTW